MPHLGRHADEYHKFMLKSVQEVSEVASGSKKVFLEGFDAVKKTVMNNP
jgi:hypothetical protein